MTLSEILAKIKRYYPKASTWTDTDIVSIINDEQREIFREMQLIDTYEFETVKDQPSYLLPANCEIEFIKYLGLATDIPVTKDSSFQEYTFCDMNDELIGYRYYDGLNKLVGLYPVPENTGYNVKIVYEKRPALLSTTNLSAIPELKEDWHRILVYGAIVEIAGAGSNPDITTANNYTIKYNDIMSEIKLAKYKSRPYPRTKIKDWSR